MDEFYLEVLLMAIDGFFDELEIGNDNFGSDYRATLEDSVQVVVKKVESSALPPMK